MSHEMPADEMTNEAPSTKHRPPAATPRSPENVQNAGPAKHLPVTVQALAEAKGLPVEFLAKFGLREGRKGILMPYLHEDQSRAVRDRLRKGLSGRDGFRWTGTPGEPMTPYGLWRLEQARSAGHVVLVTGESDWWTLAYHDVPALAIPGENMAKLLELRHLDQLDRVYVLKPAGDDKKLFARRVLKRLEKIGWPGEMYLIILPEGHWDANDLHRANPGGFKEAFERARSAAEPFPDPSSVGDPLDPGLTKVLADAISGADHFARDAAGRLFRFENGVYRPGAEMFIKIRVKQLLEQWDLTKRWTPRRGENVVAYLLLGAPELWERPPLTVISLKNGLFDLVTGTLLPHMPDHLSTVQIPIKYDPSATCLEIDQFFHDVFPPDSRDLPWEILGDVITPDRSMQKAILLLGSGGNGKSAFLNLVTEFAGRTNVAAVTLQALEANRFTAAQLYGKLANISADLPSEHLVGTSVFKSITGGDELTAEFKFQNMFKFRPFARLLFSANHLPESKDASKAFYDRWVVVNFPREFRDTEEDTPRSILDARLTAPRELSGALNKALAALKRVRERGRFTESASTREAVAEFIEATDPLAIWLNRETVSSFTAVVTKDRLFREYNLHLQLEGQSPLMKEAFGRALHRLRPGLKEAQRTIDGKPKQWCYLGIGFPDGAELGEEQEEKEEEKAA